MKMALCALPVGLVSIAVALGMQPSGNTGGNTGGAAVGQAGAAPAVVNPCANPFAPVTMHIHPLTHTDEKAPGGCSIILHFELRDAFGDGCKAVGPLRVEMFRPAAGGVAPGLETQELVWDVPELVDPANNTRRFDQATRTYRVPLLVNRALCDQLTADPSKRGRDSRWIKLKATMTVRGTDGGEKQISDEYVVSQ